MALPDTPNFSPVARVLLGVVAFVVIGSMLRYFGVV